ncbi:MAG TPA: hypothetical protein VM074_10285, partial [Solimonas sp.]|nr:hypothetical protein [Solimonas sp.]
SERYEQPTQGIKNLNSFRRDRLASYDRAANDAMRRRIGLLRIDTAAGAPMAVVINFAAHGIAFDVENQYFSGDVLASAERETEGALNVPLAMLVQNTGGDVSPRADGAPTLQRIERFGKLLAPQVKAAYVKIYRFQTAPDLRTVSQRVILSRERLGYTGAEYPYPWGAAQCNNDVGVPLTGPSTDSKNPSCLAGPPPDAIDLADNGVGENGAFLPQDTRLTAARIGSILLLAQPGEPLTEYGVRLMKLATDRGYLAENTFIWGYSQDHVGYILAPEQADWAMGGTEGTTTFWGWKQGQRLLDANVALLSALRDNRPAPDDEFQVNYGLYQSLYALAPKAPAIPSLRAGRVVAQPSAIQRFQQTAFTWEGGDPVVDSPVVTLERMDASGQWLPARRANGEIINTYFEMHLKYRLVSGAHLWTVEFEAPRDWLTGSYRFNVNGTARTAADAPYVVLSQAFAVTPSPSLQLSAPRVSDGYTSVTMAYLPRPGNYRLIDALVPSDKPAPVRQGVVSFTDGKTTILNSKPVLEARDGLLIATYHAQMTGVTRISGADIYGNTTPGAVAPPGNATVDNGTGVIRIVADLFSGLGEVATAALSGDFSGAAARLQQLLAALSANVTNLVGGDNASLVALFGNAAANLASGDPQALVAQAGADAGAIVGLASDPVTVLRRAGSADRNASAVVLLGAQLPGWSQPAAQGAPYPYPSGATITGAGPAPFNDRRDAHNGVMAYPAGWTPGSASSSLPTAVPAGEIAAFARRGAAWVEIPVQVDERYPFFLANGNSDFSVYSGTDEELTYAWDTENWKAANSADGCSAVAPRGVPDPIAGLDDDDEVAFMWSDAGEIAAPGTAAPAGAVGGMRQVALLDPLNPSSLRFVYLVRKSGGTSFDQQHYVRYQRDANADLWIDRGFFADNDPEKIGTSNTGYGPNLSGTVCQNGVKRQSTDRFPRDGLTVQTDAYRWTASGRWMVRGLQVAKPGKPGVYGVDLVDRWKGRAFQQSPDSNISVVGFEDEQVNWEANSGLLGERCGPVRCMREVWGADSGTNVTKTETFYRDAVSYRFHVRVHPIPPDGLYTAWDYNRSAMVPDAGENVAAGRYYTVLRPQGVPIDGYNDDLGQADGITPIPTPTGPLCLGSDGPVEPGPNGLCRAFFDAADPTFNLALAFDNWEQVSGKGDSGSLVYTFEMKGATSMANPLVVPYYRDDACLDDGTGDDPVRRPWPGESYTWNGGAVGKAYDAMAGRPLDYSGHVHADCEQRQGAYGAHGVHYFVTHDSDNAFVEGKPLTEVDGQQWQFAVPTSRPVNVGELYSNNVRAPIVPLVTPLGAP